ncbi:MAG: hypothetical protein AAFO69_00610 [Bacteroidota bacterium]
MFDRLKKLLSSRQEEEPAPRLEIVLKELDAAILSTEQQYKVIISQEKALQDKLKQYNQQYRNKVERAKRALQSQDQLNAENLYEESELLKKQITQYSNIVHNLHDTRQQLMAQLNQFRYTKDELLTKKTLGEANVDASQLKASLSEQLLYLSESDEFTLFDDLIAEATSKSEAIDQIRGGEATLDEYLATEATQENNRSAIDKLEQLMQAERSAKLQASLKNHQILIEQVFGKDEPSKDPEQEKNQRALLEQLKSAEAKQESKEQKVSDFFHHQEQQSTPTDHEDRIKNFFENDSPTSKSDQQTQINKFFKNH